MKRRKYSPEEIAFLAAHVVSRSFIELTDLFNAHFGHDLTFGQIKGTCKRYKLYNGRNCRFYPGQEPWNKGRKMPGAGQGTWFPKGIKPWNYRPVGSERVNGENYVDIKIADPNKWRAKHLVIWEAANGPLPPHHVVLFADGNNRNFDLANLILISRRELAVMNKRGFVVDDAEITKTHLNIARILIKRSQRLK